MTYTIEYYDMLDHLYTAVVEAETEEAAIEALANDEQHPLAQVKRVTMIEAIS